MKSDEIIFRIGKILRNRTLRACFFWILLVSSDTTAQLLLKMGAMRVSSSGRVINHLIVIGYSLYIVSFVAWMQILRNTRLFVALSAASVLYITVAFFSYLFLGEAITTHLLIGTVLISIGVFILGWSESRKEEHSE